MKKLGCLVILLIVGGIAFMTNPSEKEHIDFAYKILKKQGIERFGINPDVLIIGEDFYGKENMDFFIKKLISRKNYYVFSLTEIDIMDNKQIVAIGAFGKIWTLPNLDQ